MSLVSFQLYWHVRRRPVKYVVIFKNSNTWSAKLNIFPFRNDLRTGSSVTQISNANSYSGTSVNVSFSAVQWKCFLRASALRPELWGRESKRHSLKPEPVSETRVRPSVCISNWYRLNYFLFLVLTYWTLGTAPTDDMKIHRKKKLFLSSNDRGLVGGKDCLLASTVQQLMKLIFSEELLLKYCSHSAVSWLTRILSQTSVHGMCPGDCSWRSRSRWCEDSTFLGSGAAILCLELFYCLCIIARKCGWQSATSPFIFKIANDNSWTWISCETEIKRQNSLQVDYWSLNGGRKSWPSGFCKSDKPSSSPCSPFGHRDKWQKADSYWLQFAEVVSSLMLVILISLSNIIDEQFKVLFRMDKAKKG